MQTASLSVRWPKRLYVYRLTEMVVHGFGKSDHRKQGHREIMNIFCRLHFNRTSSSLTVIEEKPSSEDNRLLWRLMDTSVEGRATPYPGKFTSRSDRMFSLNAFKLRAAVVSRTSTRLIFAAFIPCSSSRSSDDGDAWGPIRSRDITTGLSSLRLFDIFDVGADASCAVLIFGRTHTQHNLVACLHPTVVPRQQTPSF